PDRALLGGIAGLGILLQFGRDLLLGVFVLANHVLAGAGFARRQRCFGFDQAEGGLGQPGTVVGLFLARHELAVLQARVIRIVEFEGFQAGGSQVVQRKTLIGLGHDRQAVTNRRSFLEVLYHVAATVGGGDVGLAGQVVVGDMYFIGSQQVALVVLALLGLRCVASGRVAAGELGELVVGVARGARVSLGHVQRQEARQQTAVLIERGQALEVVGIVDIGVLRVQADEALGRGLGRFRFGVLV